MLGIIDYNAGNLQSVCNALESLGTPFVVASSPDALINTEKVIFPGVGHAKSCMKELQNRGFDAFLKTTEKSVLGICVGMQMLFDFSEEGDTKCLGIISGSVKKFDQNLVHIVPHMGWNEITHTENPLFENTPQKTDFYFVHSYYCDPFDSSKTIASTVYENFSFCSAIQQKNIWGVQFHPEKSGKEGLSILRHFVEM